MNNRLRITLGAMALLGLSCSSGSAQPAANPVEDSASTQDPISGPTSLVTAVTVPTTADTFVATTTNIGPVATGVVDVATTLAALPIVTVSPEIPIVQTVSANPNTDPNQPPPPSAENILVQNGFSDVDAQAFTSKACETPPLPNDLEIVLALLTSPAEKQRFMAALHAECPYSD